MTKETKEDVITGGIAYMLDMLCCWTGNTPEQIMKDVIADRAWMIKQGKIKTVKTPHGDIDMMDHPLLPKLNIEED